jgi:FtsZ-binding cell division protein ZapB
MMKLNDSIIQFQQQQIDELLERNQELRKEKQWLERKIELLEVEKDARFN